MNLEHFASANLASSFFLFLIPAWTELYYLCDLLTFISFKWFIFLYFGVITQCNIALVWNKTDIFFC